MQLSMQHGFFFGREGKNSRETTALFVLWKPGSFPVET